jgi:hypothetical protein
VSAPPPEHDVLTVPDVHSLLEGCAADAEARMELAADAAAARIEGSSVYELVRIVEEEALALGLASRHAVRLSVEAVLSHGSSASHAKELAAAVHEAASGEAPVRHVLSLLASEGADARALNVLSVLCFSELISSDALSRWEDEAGQTEGGAADVERLRPLLSWIRKEPEPETEPEAAAGEGTLELADATPTGRDGDNAALDATLPPRNISSSAQPASSVAEEHCEQGRVWRAVTCSSGGKAGSDWIPSCARAVLNVELGPAREAVVVLDGLVDEPLRAELLRILVGEEQKAGTSVPPAGRWERTTCDGAGLPRSWGLQPRLLERLERTPPPCVVEVQTRLQRLYPEYHIGHFSMAGAAGATAGANGDAEYCCTSFVANAAVYGNSFQWHVDGDPACFPPGPWLSTYGHYQNGAPGKPLLVSLLVYLDEHWQKDWDAETLFTSDESGVGVLVQPRPARAVLMHQDVLHRVSCPSLSARRPRYSLVWKLVFSPRGGSQAVAGEGDEGIRRDGEGLKGEMSQSAKPGRAPSSPRETICRPEFGSPARIGN